ncbi:Uncharacterized protein family UPF0004 [seawater metagenome]|uniref:tRNA (N(6)-L-threonylcarbamoyladenosine(37)-C(2))-methylthiotransferase n=1 Tax=seawater metagenome TaxID=1561972 RepID=A0A5E8CIQ0_9ZZZZ
MSCGTNMDIEDLNFDLPDLNDKKKRMNSGLRNVKTKKRLTEEIPDKIIPGTQKIYVKTWGCPHNLSDSQYMTGILAEYGYIITEKKQEADLWLLNSCTVKGPSEKSFIKEIKLGETMKKFIVLAGCVPQGDRHNKNIQGYSVVGVQQIDRVLEVVEQTLKGNIVRLLGRGRKPRLDLPKIRSREMTEIIPISKGCLGSCTFCKTKHARGNVGSYEIEAILDRIVTVIEEGVIQIDLESEDSGAYGKDIGTSLSELLAHIVEILPKDKHVMVKFGMTNPPHILEQLDAISDFLNHPNVYSYLHIPVQSGSSKVLKEMNREYNIEEFCDVVDHMYENVPNITIQTDIIVGFPTETDADFEETIELVKKYKFKFIHISKFYPRPGTPAAKLPLIDGRIVNQRSKTLTELYKSYLPNEHFKNQILKLYVSDQKSKYKNYLIAHDKSYNNVLVPYDKDKIGKTLDVKIIDVDRFHMKAEYLKPNYQWFYLSLVFPIILSLIYTWISYFY